ncbi:amidase signature domain-containing protein [Mycena leptocephala]|nr:amidase signature domain-containing protein [Mycena leptocephala]
MNLEELDITSLDQDATSILAQIKSKELTAVQVVLAFAKRAAIAHQLLCCLSNFFLEDALIRAKELDDFYSTTGKLVGPLHVMVQDSINLAGQKSTAGFSGDILQPPATKNGFLAQILYDAGAVFYVKTNLPQCIMHLETYSFWGQVLNPYNTKLTPGGSSGGCSALVAFGGSPLGIGSDIGGSLRSPANACGIWTLKPTTLRVPKGVGATAQPGADSILSTFGPLCRSLRDIDLWFSVVLGSKPWLHEYNLVPIPWEIPIAPCWSGSNDCIRIGVMWHDDVHELYFVDGGAHVRARAAVSGEPILPLTEWLWELNLRREALRAEYLEHYNVQNVDVVLSPAGAGPAPALGTCKYWGYTNVWNFVDYPAAVFPTGLYSDPTIDVKDIAPRTHMSEADAYNSDCLSRRFKDEIVVKALQEISRVLPLM